MPHLLSLASCSRPWRRTALVRQLGAVMTRKRAAAVLAAAASNDKPPQTKKRKSPAAAAGQSAKPAASAVAAAEPGTLPGTVLRYEGLVPGQLLRRYKRFLGDVQLAPLAPSEGRVEAEEHTVVHVPNTGPMTGLLDALPSPVLLSTSSNAKRKYAHTLEWIRVGAEGTWVGVHSARANAMVAHLLHHRLLPGLPPYNAVQPEVKYGSDGKSRVDFVLHGAEGSAPTHVEVKSVTLAESLPEGEGRIALFPDTVSERAQRHVKELTSIAKAGGRAALVFAVQRSDCCAFAPCHEKDPAYGRLVVEAAAAGVVVVAVVCRLDETAGEVVFGGALPMRLDYKYVQQG